MGSSTRESRFDQMSEQTCKTRIFSQKHLYLFFSAFFLIPNLMYLYNAWFVRHRADDFCFSGTFREYGFLDGLSHFYLTISNRFSAFMLWSVSDLLGEKAIRFFPMFAILLTVFALYMFARFIAKSLEIKYADWLAFFVSQMLTFFFLYLSPSIDQSVYWRAAMVHYFLPFPVLLFMVRFVLEKSHSSARSLLNIFLFFLLAFFMAGLSESYAALQGAVFMLVLAYTFLHLQRKEKTSAAIYSLAVIVGTISALVVMILSPGNTLKMTLLDQAQDVGTIISISLNSAYSFIFYTIRGGWLPFFVLLLLGSLIALFVNYERKNQLKPKAFVHLLLIIPVFIFILIASIAAPTAYGMTAYPEKRVLMLGLMVLVCAVFAEGFLLGIISSLFLPGSQWVRIFVGFALLGLSIYPLRSLPGISTMINFYRERAGLWDQQQEEIFTQISAGQQDLVVTALDAHAEIAEMRESSTFWVNLCSAQYYNVDTITAIER